MYHAASAPVTVNPSGKVLAPKHAEMGVKSPCRVAVVGAKVRVGKSKHGKGKLKVTLVVGGKSTVATNK